MSQLSNSSARVINPILTSVAQGYKNSTLVGGNIFPNVPVMQRGGKIIQFGKEDFMSYDTERAPGSDSKLIQIGYSGSDYALSDHTLGAVVPRELQEEALAVPGINLARGAVNKVQNALSLRLEIEQANLATTAGNYGASNKVTLSGTSQWSDLTNGVSDPVANVETGKEAVRAAIGKRANTIIIGAAVWKSLKQHPKIIDRIKYTGRDVPTTALLASLFDVDMVVVGDAVKADDAGTFSDVWGKFVVIAYTEKSGLADMGSPTYGYTYQLGGYPLVEQPYWNASKKSWIYDVSDAVKPVIAAASAGYLISAAVA